MSEPKYKRVMLKLSGEALSGEKGFGIDFEFTKEISEQIKKLVDMGIEVGAVVGGGNIWRGRSGSGMDRTTADIWNVSYLYKCFSSSRFIRTTWS